MKIGLISLGCSKNLVDSEMILGLVKHAGATIVNNPSEADIIIINTCGFIESAKKEAIDTIFEMCDYKENGAKIVVTGCLTERYLNELKEMIPEVDLFIPIRDYGRFGELISPLLETNFSGVLHHEDRFLTTQPHMAYVKISEGCDNRCHYCAIPLIRGGFKSRIQEEIVNEVKGLVEKGVKEIILISQDTTRYGTDLSGNYSICTLLKALVGLKMDSLRILYLYPEEMTNDLIKVIKDNSVIAPYFDLPIQHASNEVLKSMNRRDKKESMLTLFKNIKKEIPNAILRTTVIVGYPGETRAQFMELVDFIKDVRFDRLGCFMFSKEEGTVACDLPNQVSEATKKRRFETIMGLQEQISYEQGLKRVGEETLVRIEDYDAEGKMYIGRDFSFAPDDIDGCIFVDTDEVLEIGKSYLCTIINADIYNLYAKTE